MKTIPVPPPPAPLPPFRRVQGEILSRERGEEKKKNEATNLTKGKGKTTTRPSTEAVLKTQGMFYSLEIWDNAAASTCMEKKKKEKKIK